MIEKNISAIDWERFDRVIITIVESHERQYGVTNILRQALSGVKFDICILSDFTQGPAETIFLTLEKMQVNGPFVVKDADNAVSFRLKDELNFVVGLDISNSQDVKRLGSKSFVVVNEHGLVSDVVEKKIISETICVGVYGFESPQDFINEYRRILEHVHASGEIFVSHVIASLLASKKQVFQFIPALMFEDWGTFEDWQIVQKFHSTYFVDIDGVILENRGRYGQENWGNYVKPIHDNIERLKELVSKGAQIVFVTSRPREFIEPVKRVLEEYGLKYVDIICGLNHSPRILINDFAPTNPYPSALAVSMPRDSALRQYI